jgi:WD40 repeat protein
VFEECLVRGGICNVGFSPDGRWLVTGSLEYRLWKLGSWKEGPRLGAAAGSAPVPGHAFAFAPDGKTLALTGMPGQVRLVDPDSGDEIVRLTAPEPTYLSPQCFSTVVRDTPETPSLRKRSVRHGDERSDSAQWARSPEPPGGSRSP